MKKLIPAILTVWLLLLSVGMVSQVNTHYPDVLKTIDSLRSKGLPQSALKEVDYLLTKSSKDGNQALIIKALLIRLSLQGDYEEGHPLKGIQQLQQALDNATSPEREIIHSLLAQVIQQYYLQNQWAVLQRTVVYDNDSQNPDTWDAQEFLRKIRQHYLYSLDNRDNNKQISLKDFSSLLVNEETYSWTSVYDLLAQRAITYFSHAELDPAGDGMIRLPENNPFLTSREQFIRISLSEVQMDQNMRIVLRTYQDVLTGSLGSDNNNMMTGLDLARLEYVYKHTLSGEESFIRYRKALEKIISNSNDIADQFNPYWQLANLLNNAFVDLSPSTGTVGGQEVIGICEKALSAFPDSVRQSPFRNILQQVKQVNIKLMAEEVVVPGCSVPAELEVKNVTEVYFKVVKISPDDVLEDKYNDQKQLMKLLDKSPVITFQQTVPDSHDYRSHSYIISVPALRSGLYMMLVSDNPTFDPEGSLYFRRWNVSGLGYLNASDAKSDTDVLLVVDRTTGIPLSGVNVKVYDKQYDHMRRAYRTSLIGTTQSDKKGYADLSAMETGRQHQVILLLTKGDDQYIFNYRPGYFGWYAGVDTTTRTYLFTDRAIYRPGQMVYFKAIVIKKNDHGPLLVKNRPDIIQLLGAGQNKLEEVPVVTDDNGSYHGSFVLPDDILKGQVLLRTTTGAKTIRVEEYKRPRFHIETNPMKGQYVLGDTVNVSGMVEDYAGISISGADIQYVITRNNWTPIPYRGAVNIRPIPTVSRVVASGVTTTSDNGSFEFAFLSFPEEDLHLMKDQYFQYEVEIDATDMTGEVQQTRVSIPVGSTAVLLNIDGPDIMIMGEGAGCQIKANNLDGNSITLPVDLSWYRLTAPQKMKFEAGLNPGADNLLSEATWREQFPLLGWEGEELPENMPRNLISKTKLTIEGVNTPELPDDIRRTPGWYALEVTGVDDRGNKLIRTQYFLLINPGSRTMPAAMPFFAMTDKMSAQLGQRLNLYLGSSERNARILLTVIHGEEIVSNQVVYPKGKQVSVAIPVTENLRGGFSVNAVMVLHNRFFQHSFSIDVPFLDKRLDVQLLTHQNMLTPGAPVSWKVHISGPDRTVTAAQLMATMYDAALDQFADNQWKLDLYPKIVSGKFWTSNGFNQLPSRVFHQPKLIDFSWPVFSVPTIDWYGYLRSTTPYPVYRGMAMDKSMTIESELTEDDIDVVVSPEQVEEKKDQQPDIPLRTNFSETAFFYPDLSTDKDGNVEFSFTTPDALTTWKLMMLAYTNDLKVGAMEQQIKAQKDLMILPHLPRFVRQGDEVVLSAKVVGLVKDSVNVHFTASFFDPRTGESLDIPLENTIFERVFILPPMEGIMLEQRFLVPDDIDLLGISYTARSSKHQDGVSQVIPVLSNKMLITETMPMPVGPGATKSFEMRSLINMGKIMRPTSIQNFGFTVEFTSNPAWYAVQALPSMESVQGSSVVNCFDRYMANALSAFIVNSNPGIREVFEKWQETPDDVLISNLNKNESLKSVLSASAPWVLEAQNETEQKRRIALLFDLNRMNEEKQKTFTMLRNKQLSDGSWPWFEGMYGDIFTTQTIVSGLARLHDKGVLDLNSDQARLSMLKKSVRFLDNKLISRYELLKKNQLKTMKEDHLGALDIQYLYTRSLLLQIIPLDKEVQKAVDYYVSQARQYWLDKSNYLQGMIALSMPEYGYRNVSEAILRSLTERALTDKNGGLYWKMTSGWNWYQSPIETQAMMIEVFNRLQRNRSIVDQMKWWLLSQKQTNRWNTNSGTAEAVYALLLTGPSLLTENHVPEVMVGDISVGELLEKEGRETEAGTGYFQYTWSQTEMNPEMGHIKIHNNNNIQAWGASYWQYFENIDKVIPASTGLSIQRQLFVEMVTDSGRVLVAVKRGSALHLGDKVVSRLIITTDRDLEFVHLSDTRASGFEPVSALSGYAYSGGLGYYRQVGDSKTDFFIRSMSKGTYVFENASFVTQQGQLADGPAVVQSLYAPEIAAHSAGTKIDVE